MFKISPKGQNLDFCSRPQGIGILKRKQYYKSTIADGSHILLFRGIYPNAASSKLKSNSYKQWFARN
jgi:hypothetical protein